MWGNCDPVVQDAFTKASKYMSKFMAQDNWVQIVNNNISANQHSIDGFTQQMLDAWKAGKYYEAGMSSGLVMDILYTNPNSTL